MFVQAIEFADKFTRSIHFISRNYGSNHVVPLTATLFFVNADGWALTCGHVARLIINAQKINEKFEAYKSELVALQNQKQKKPKSLQRKLARKYDYSGRIACELHQHFRKCVTQDDGYLSLDFRLHDKLDLALMKFNNFNKLLCDTFPIFPADTSGLKSGKFLCRLGYPFPEFTNYAYDEQLDSIRWTEDGKKNSPAFPIEGMVTRYILDENKQKSEFELSTAGLRGQSGGPAFDVDGKVWGMQSSTNHLDLDFDVDQEVIRNGLKARVKNSPFLHVGHCIHVDLLKSFMTEHDVEFQQE